MSLQTIVEETRLHITNDWSEVQTTVLNRCMKMFDFNIRIEKMDIVDTHGTVHGLPMKINYTLLRHETRAVMIFIIRLLDVNTLAEIERTRTLYTTTHASPEGADLKVFVFAARITDDARDTYTNHMTRVLVPQSFDAARDLLQQELAVA